jgi:hypothetical protein
MNYYNSLSLWISIFCGLPASSNANASASRATDQLVPTDGNQQINGSLENEAHERGVLLLHE